MAPRERCSGAILVMIALLAGLFCACAEHDLQQQAAQQRQELRSLYCYPLNRWLTRWKQIRLIADTSSSHGPLRRLSRWRRSLEERRAYCADRVSSAPGSPPVARTESACLRAGHPLWDMTE